MSIKRTWILTAVAFGSLCSVACSKQAPIVDVSDTADRPQNSNLHEG